MSQAQLFRRNDVAFDAFGEDGPGTGTIARLVGPEMSKTLGGGLITLDGTAVEWTLLYDELIVGIEGVFQLRIGDKVLEARQGDVIWIPEGTTVVYGGEKAVIFYALAPVNWREKLKKA